MTTASALSLWIRFPDAFISSTTRFSLKHFTVPGVQNSWPFSPPDRQRAARKFSSTASIWAAPSSTAYCRFGGAALTVPCGLVYRARDAERAGRKQPARTKRRRRAQQKHEARLRNAWPDYLPEFPDRSA